MKIINILFSVSLTLIATYANAEGLKVFGPEFCTATYGYCINFHYKDLKDAKTWTGDYKYPKGRKAYDECVKKIEGTDGDYAYCAMVFHREEQSANKRLEMCQSSVMEKYRAIVSSSSALRFYDIVWGCSK